MSAALLLASAASRAEPTAPDRATAEALFKEGRTLVKTGDYASGCPKFKASLALDPRVSTWLNLAECHEHEGKLATATGDYAQALALNRGTSDEELRQRFEAIATRGLVALEARLPRVRIVVTNSPPGLKVLRDDKEIAPAALGEALPADPGPHQVTAGAPGYRDEARAVTLVEGETTTVALTLSPAARGGAPVWAWVTGGAGLALAGAGAYFLADDLAATSALHAHCTTSSAATWCKPGWYDYASDNARKDRGFGLFVGLGGAGALALGAAVFGLVRAPPSQESPRVTASVWVTPSTAGALMGGSF